MSDSMPSAPEAYPTGPPPPYNAAGGDNEQVKGNNSFEFVSIDPEDSITICHISNL